MRFHYLRLTAVGFGLRWSARLSGLLTGRCCSFNLDSSSLAWLRGEPSTVVLLLCLPSGCGHPLGSLVSFVPIDRHWRSFLLCGSLPFRCGVVVSLHPLPVCHGSSWLVTALFPSLSLYLPVSIFSCLHLLLSHGPWVSYLALPMVVHTLAVGPGVSYAS